MKQKGKNMKLILMLLAVSGATFSASADGESVSNATFKAGLSSPVNWNDTSIWADGVPADGAGATATVRLDGSAPSNPIAVNFNRDVTLGHIIRPADDTQGSTYSSHEWRDCLLFRWDWLVKSDSDSYAPMNTFGQKTPHHYPVTLTMDSGSPSVKASIQHLVPSETMSGKRFGFFIEPPIRLLSDLYLRYIGPADGIYGTGWKSGNLGGHTDGAMYLTGGISEGAAGMGVEIDNPVITLSKSYAYTPVFLGGTSTFTGPLEITSGMLRLLGEGRFEGDCHAVGKNNHVYATTGNGVLDLAGTRAGLDGNTLHLGGVPQRSEMGTLINTNPDPMVPGEWAGAVVIESATKIGGYTQNPSGDKLGGGDIVLSGPVSGSADVEIVNPRETVLAGDNSGFTGDWILSGGGFFRLRGDKAVGKNGEGSTLRFASWMDNTYYPAVGTGYRFGEADDADLTEFNYDISNKNFRIDVAAGLEYHPANGFKGLAVENANAALFKTGPGTLRLTEESTWTGTRNSYDTSMWLAIADGTVVMDFTENHNPKLVHSISNIREGTVYFGENARLEVRGTPVSKTGYYQYIVGAGGFATIHFDDEGHSGDTGYWMRYGDFGGGDWGTTLQGGVMNIEADPSKWVLLAEQNYAGVQTHHDANYPSIRHPGEIWNGTTFTKRSDAMKWTQAGLYNYILEPAPDSWYAHDFATVSANATSTANSLVDVTAELCAQGAHSGIECAALRFNTPNGGTPVVLDLAGTIKIHSGTILITPNMGDTPVIIRGGHIVRDPIIDSSTYRNAGIRILNFNTNATVTIECDLGADTVNLSDKLVRGTVLFAGPGKTIFTGKFLASGAIGVNAGVLSCGDGTKMLASYPASGDQWNKTWAKFREIYLYGGGLVEFTEDAPWTCEVAGQVEPTSANTYRNGWRPHIGVTGGGFSVSKGMTLAVNASDWEAKISVQRGATFIKDGEGTISFPISVNWEVDSYSVGTGGKLNDRIYRLDLRGGTIGRFADPAYNGIDVNRMLFGGNGAVVVTAHDGTTMVGREFSTTRFVDNNRASQDAGNGVRIVIPHGATATHDRHTTKTDTSIPGESIFGGQYEWFSSGLRTGGLWAGAGTLVLTNSSGTAAMAWAGFKNRLFTGAIIDHVGTGDQTATGSSRFVGYVPALENARLFLPEGVKWYIGYGMDLDGSMPFRLGGLDGTGTLDCQARWQHGIESPRIGCNDGESHDFAGYLGILRNGEKYGQLVKVGSNTQRISGMANQLQTSAKVVDGTLVLGHLRALDSTDKPGSWNNVYVGSDETTSEMKPRFLVDCGNVTVTNKVKVLGCAAMPAVGAKSGVVTFKEVVVSNACSFVAEEGATAKFDKVTVLGGPYPIGQSGSIEIAGDLAVSDRCDLEWGGVLAVGGELTVADGTKLNISIPTGLELGQRYVLVQAGSGITGQFDMSDVVLPRGCKIVQNGRTVVLSTVCGVMLFVR